MWGGADPGGIGKFGVARLSTDGSFQTKCVSSVFEAGNFLGGIPAVGIDAPLWWSFDTGGGRQVDTRLRRAYALGSTVAGVNSLQGAAVVQGIMLAMRLREFDKAVIISETHPKALIKALVKRERLPSDSWKSISTAFHLAGVEPATEHERDALMGAVVVREASSGNFSFDLASGFEAGSDPTELDPKALWFGQVHYWWFEDIFK